MAIIDNFPAGSAMSQARNFELITPGTGDLTRRYKAIYIGTGGVIQLVGDSSDNPVPHTVQDGAFLIASPRKILASGTTASGIVGWF